MEKNRIEVYEEECKFCDGTGYLLICGYGSDPPQTEECSYCSGEGKIDWINKVKITRR